MAQQTAVDYLVNLYYTEYDILLPSEDFAKAKQMEKEQIINAFENGIIAYDDPDRINDDINFDAENYYNETYEKDNAYHPRLF